METGNETRPNPFAVDLIKEESLVMEEEDINDFATPNLHMALLLKYTNEEDASGAKNIINKRKSFLKIGRKRYKLVEDRSTSNLEDKSDGDPFDSNLFLPSTVQGTNIDNDLEANNLLLDTSAVDTILTTEKESFKAHNCENSEDSDENTEDPCKLTNRDLLLKILKEVERIDGVAKSCLDISLSNQMMLTQIEKRCQNMSDRLSVAVGINPAFEESFRIPELPVRSFDEFNILEEFLNQNENNYSALVCRLRNVGGSNADTFAKLAMELIMNDVTGMHFNLEGRKSHLSKGCEQTKLAFTETLCFKAIIDALKSNKSTEHADPLKARARVGSWLQMAPWRKGGKRRRLKKTVEAEKKMKREIEEIDLDKF